MATDRSDPPIPEQPDDSPGTTDGTARSSDETAGGRGPRARVVFVAFALFGGLALWGASGRELWRTEIENALILREMDARLSTDRAPADSAPGWSPSLFGEPYLVTPPLYFWLSSAVHRTTRMDTRFAHRVPALAFALLSLWLTFTLGRSLFDGRTAFLAMTVQATTALFFFEATWLGPELAFVSLCQLSLTGFVLGARRNRSRRWNLAGWLGLTGASLTIGLLPAFVVVVPVLVCFHFFGGGLAAVKQNFRSAAASWAWATVPAIAGPWYVWASLVHGGRFVEQHFALGGLSRSAELVFLPASPVVVLLLGFLPWTIFLPLGVLHGKDRTSRPGERLCMSWLFVTLLSLTLLPLGSSAFVLFCWPPISLLIPAAFYETKERYSVWEDYLNTGAARVLPTLLRLPIALLLVVLILWFSEVFRGWMDPRIADVLWESSQGLPLTAVAAVGAVGAIIAAPRVGRLVRSGETGTAVFESARVTLFVLLTVGFASSALDPVESPRLFLDDLKSRVGDQPFATYGPNRPAEVSYYLGRSVDHFEELDPRVGRDAPLDSRRTQLLDFLRRRETVYILMPSPALEGLDIQFPGLRGHLKSVVLRGAMGARGEFVLTSNKASD